MRKTTKGALAIGAGVALLLGGAGTLAKWTVSDKVSSGTTITAGDLAVAGQTGGAWTWGDGTALPSTLANLRVVPGDSLKYTQKVRISGTGDHLVAKATFVVPGYSTTPNGLETLLGGTNTTIALGTPTVVGTAPTGASASVASNVVTLTAGTGGKATYDVPVTVTVTFPSTSTDNTLQDLAASLQDGAVTFVQQ